MLRYLPRLSEGRLKEAAALQAPTWRKLEKEGAQLTDAERRQIFDYPDFAMILWKHRRKHDLAVLVASLPVDSLFHTLEQKEAQERQQWLQQQQGKLLQHRLRLQQQRLQVQQDQQELTVVGESVSYHFSISNKGLGSQYGTIYSPLNSISIVAANAPRKRLNVRISGRVY